MVIQCMMLLIQLHIIMSAPVRIARQDIAVQSRVNTWIPADTAWKWCAVGCRASADPRVGVASDHHGRIFVCRWWLAPQRSMGNQWRNFQWSEKWGDQAKFMTWCTYEVVVRSLTSKSGGPVVRTPRLQLRLWSCTLPTISVIGLSTLCRHLVNE